MVAAVVGLGNPGPQYANSPHNAGFAVVDCLARRWGVDLTPDGAVNMGMATVGGAAVALVQPLLFVNRSGTALRDSPRLRSRVHPLIVVHDDLDLDPGRVRIKRGGGSAGHRGVESIAAVFGPDFLRVRVGIGRPPPGTDPADFVLRAASGALADILAEAVRVAADAVECVLQNGEQIAMNRFNARHRPGPEGASVAAIRRS